MEVTVTDANLDPVSWVLEGADASLFETRRSDYHQAEVWTAASLLGVGKTNLTFMIRAYDGIDYSDNAISVNATVTQDTTSPPAPAPIYSPGSGSSSPKDPEPGVCPTETAPFNDLDQAPVAKAAINCLHGLKITAGTTPDTYSPKQPVTRAQMALFLARLWQSL